MIRSLGRLTVTVAAAAGIQAARTRAVRRRIVWAPGGGSVHRGALYARRLGRGPSGVLLLHGLGGSGAYWGATYDQLAEAGCLVVPDLLGFGESPRPSSGYTADDHVDALVALLEELGIAGPLVVAGHSVGSLVALALADRHPGLVSSVVTVCPPLYRNETAARTRIARLGPIERQLARNRVSARRLCEWVCAHQQAAAILAAVLRPGVPRIIRRDGLNHSWASYFETFRDVLAGSQGPRWLASVGVPVDLVAGDKDRVTDVAYLQQLADQLPFVSLRVEAGRHDLPLTRSSACVAIIESAVGRRFGQVGEAIRPQGVVCCDRLS